MAWLRGVDMCIDCTEGRFAGLRSDGPRVLPFLGDGVFF